MQPDSDYDYTERAAIMEFDGGLSRREAEQRAWLIVYRRTETYTRRDGTKATNLTLTANKERPQTPPPPGDFEQLPLISREQYLDGMQRYLRD